MLDLTNATVNTILLALVAGLLGLVARIFWSGINNFRSEMKELNLVVMDVKHDLVEVKVGISNIDTWKEGKDILDKERKEHVEQRFKGLEKAVEKIVDKQA